MRSIVTKMWCCGAKSFRASDPDPEPLPEGHVRVYVGKDDVLCKFEMEANYLNHPLFESLLRLSEEEFGYSYRGALRIACEIDLFQYLIHLFQYLIHLLETSNPSAHYMDLSDLMSKFSSRSNKSAKASAKVCSVTTFGQLLAEQ